MKIPTPLEEDEQKALVHWLKVARLPHHSIPNSQELSGLNRIHAMHLMKKLKALGLSPGVPDLVVFLPRILLYIEMKRVGSGKVKDNQKLWCDTINSYPYARAVICYGCEQAIYAIKNLIKDSTWTSS